MRGLSSDVAQDRRGSSREFQQWPAEALHLQAQQTSASTWSSDGLSGATAGAVAPTALWTSPTPSIIYPPSESHEETEKEVANDRNNTLDNERTMSSVSSASENGTYSSLFCCGTCVGFFKANMSAFVTFLKAMFGVSLLSSPYVMVETGLLLGTLAYVVIISACTFACYLILKARAAVATALNAEHRQAQMTEPPFNRMQQQALRASNNSHKGSITFGVLGKELFGGKISVLIIFAIVTIHVCFGAGMLASASHQLAVGLGWQKEGGHEQNDEDDDAGYHMIQSMPLDRLVRVCMLFPIVATLLQFRSQFELFLLCSIGLFLYVFGCIGSIFYTTILLVIYDDDSESGSSEDDRGPPGNAAPDDMWQWKFAGIPHFVASTISVIEGINLALPTANSMQQQRSKQRRKQLRKAVNSHSAHNVGNEITNAIPVVSAVIVVYGILTLAVSWVGYLNGLGGGEGTIHGEDACEQIAYCLDSDLLTKIHQISLGATLLLTLPIILYPSIEMLEIWADEREVQLNTGRTSSDSSIATGWNGFVMGGQSLRRSLVNKPEAFYDESDPSKYSESGYDDDDISSSTIKTCLPKHWRLRLSHAVAISILAVAKRSFEPFFALLKGVGLSFIGFMLPCIFFVQAHNKYHTFGFIQMSLRLKLALVFLVALGISNIVLVYMSVFTEHNFMPEDELHREPPGEEQEQEV